MKYTKYNKPQLEKLVKEFNSFSEILRHLGKKPVGGSIHNLSLMCKRWNIDTTHMIRNYRKGKRALNRKPADQWLVMGKPSDHRTEPSKLRRSLDEIGVPYICTKCGINSWLGVPLTLEIDHIDERYWNNTKENLQYLCPNCHTIK